MELNMKKYRESGRVTLAAEAASPVRFSMVPVGVRWGVVGASMLGLVGGALLLGAGPTTAPDAAVTPGTTSAAGPVAQVAGPAVPGTGGAGAQDQNNGFNRRGNGANGGNGGGGGGGNGRQGRTGRGGFGNGNGNGNGNDRGGGGGGVMGPIIAPSDPYGILEVRSIFVNGNQNLVNPAPAYRPPPANLNPFPNAHKPSQLIFNGVTIANDKAEAFVEDLTTNIVGRVKTGDMVAGGTVTGINFDELAFTGGDGVVKHVGLGRDFNGDLAFQLAPVAPTTAPTDVPGQMIGAGASIPPPPVVSTQSGLSSQDILARMKAKRDQEAQQLGK